MKSRTSSTIQGIGETLKDLGKDTVKESAKAVASIGKGMFEQLLGIDKRKTPDLSSPQLEKKQEDVDKLIRTERRRKRRIEFTFFRGIYYQEQVLIKREIERILREIRAEVEALRKTTSEITSEMREIEKISLENLPEKVGVYHVRFLEVILKLIKSLRAKASESKTWLEALITRKKKRGSLFLALAKKKGTQYSLSQELQTARAVQ